ncbi:MAG: 30S ribosomal protein S13 [Candidatus Diapherotrites archaeon]|nr:30S ribosomal protein S13 [Candidatus Diapherotrites archaeon]
MAGKNKKHDAQEQKEGSEKKKGKTPRPEHAEKPKAVQPVEMEPGMRYIVRISAKDLNGNLPIYRALASIRGIGLRMARNMAITFEQETKIPFDSRLGKLSEEMDKTLQVIVINPGKHGIPQWSLNRKKEFETGENRHLVMADLDLQLRKDLQRLNLIKSYRGLRHSWGLPVRGQRTKSTHRGKGPVVGVLKKEAKAAMAAAGKETEKKDEKKK